MLRVLALSALISTVATADSKAATRIALVDSDSNAGLETVLDTATVLLSKDADLQLLDRAEVGRLLHEQELSLAGLVGVEHALKAGQLLHVDLFAVLEGTLTNGDSSPSLGLVVFDARTGVRYADSALVASNTLSAASATAAAVRAAVAKSHQEPGDLHTVGLLTVRNADLPRQYDSLCDTVGLLLERELTASPGIAVLERRRLEQINKERDLTLDAERSRLLASLRLIGLDIGRDGAGLRGTLGLTTADGSQTNGLQGSVPTRNAADLAQLLAQKVESLLQAAPSQAAFERQGEAKRFRRESKLLEEHRDYPGAVRALDAALALSSTEPSSTLEMIKLLSDGAVEMIDPGGQHRSGAAMRQPTESQLAAGLAFGHRAMDMLLDYWREAVATAKDGHFTLDPTNIENARSLSRPGSSLSHMLEKAAYARETSQAVRAHTSELFQMDRTMRLDVLEPFYRSQAHDRPGFVEYSWRLDDLVFSLDFGKFDPEQMWKDAVQGVRSWLALARRFNRPDGTGLYSPFSATLARFLHNEVLPPSAEYRSLLKGLYQDPDPFMRLEACLAGAEMFGPSVLEPDQSLLQAVREFRRYAQGLLARSPATRLSSRELFELKRQGLQIPAAFDNPVVVRERIWLTLEEALRKIAGQREAEAEYLEACHFAFKQKEVRVQLFEGALDVLDNPTNRQPVEALEVLNGVLELRAESPDSFLPARLTLRSLQERRDRLTGVPVGSRVQMPSPWLRVVKLLDLRDPTIDSMFLCQPVVQGEVVYAAAFDRSYSPEHTLKAFRIPLEGGTPSVLAETQVEGDSWGFLNRDNIRGVRPRTACFGVDNYFLGTETGVYVFPTQGGKVTRLCSTNGLPADEIQSLAFMDGKLYVGSGAVGRAVGRAGYLAVYDLASGRIDVPASSRRSQHLSPFDDQPPFFAASLIPDPPRHRLLMLAWTPPSAKNLRGVWAFSPGTAEFKHILELPLYYNDELVRGNTWSSQVDENSACFCVRYWELALVDLRNDTFRFHGAAGSASGQVPPAPWPSLLHSPTTTVYPPFFLLDGWLWSATPRVPAGNDFVFHRTSLETGTIEDVPDPPITRKLQARAGLQAFQLLPDRRRVLLADEDTIWLLEFAAEPAHASAEPSQKGK